MEVETTAVNKVMKALLAMFFLEVVILSSEAMLDPLDFLALQSIRKSMDDMPGSTFFKSWDFSSDPCSFSGVLCESQGGSDRVVTLNLGDASAGAPGLTGKLDGALGCFSSLAELTIVPGLVAGSIPETLGQCKELQFVGISKNLLSGTIPPCLGALQKLQTLDLSFNKLVGGIPRDIGQLPILSNLILSHNKLIGSIPTFKPTLTRLDLKHNKLSGSLPSLPTSLQYLSLSNNKLNGNIEMLSSLQRLSYLDLSFNQFSGSIPSILFSFPLMSLQMQRNSFSGLIAPQVQVNIPTVDLSYNLLTGQVSPLLAYVQSLYLNDNHLTGAVPEEFTNRLLSADIQVLYLQLNYLTHITLKPSTTLPLTSSLCIHYNCMLLPIQPPCPFKAGKQKKRPTYQCNMMG